MKELTIDVKNPVAAIEDGKPVIKYESRTDTAIVASTKSANNLLDEYKQRGDIVVRVSERELYLIPEDIKAVLADAISAQIADSEIAEHVLNAAMKALDGACMFKRPPVVRKKA